MNETRARNAVWLIQLYRESRISLTTLMAHLADLNEAQLLTVIVYLVQEHRGEAGDERMETLKYLYGEEVQS